MRSFESVRKLLIVSCTRSADGININLIVIRYGLRTQTHTRRIKTTERTLRTEANTSEELLDNALWPVHSKHDICSNTTPTNLWSLDLQLHVCMFTGIHKYMNLCMRVRMRRLQRLTLCTPLYKFLLYTYTCTDINRPMMSYRSTWFNFINLILFVYNNIM